MIILRVAWRNLWRNPRRTLITASAMAFGMAMMVITVALMQGLMAQMERYATVLGPGHIQLHHPRYLEDRSIWDGIPGAPAVLEAVERGVGGAAAPRTYAIALASSGPRSSGAQLWGVDPERESEVTEFHRHIETGSFLSPGGVRELVLGTNLARNLGVRPGDEIVLLTQAADGSLGNALFRVRGVLKPLGEALDRGGIFLRLADLDELAVLEGKVHEVAVRLPDPSALEKAAASLRGESALAGIEVKTWKQVMPEIAESLRLYDAMQYITLLIIFAAAALVIMDSQLMALFERTREIGVLRALGMGPGPVALLVLVETFLLTVLAVAGGSLGGYLLYLPMRDGWDVSAAAGGFSFAGVAFEPVLRARLTLSSFTMSASVVLAVAFAAVLYPVARAVRVTPMAAIREAGR